MLQMAYQHLQTIQFPASIMVFQAKRLRKLSGALASISSYILKGTVKERMSLPKGLFR
jgi:hypothetical protein